MQLSGFCKPGHIKLSGNLNVIKILASSETKFETAGQYSFINALPNKQVPVQQN